LSKRCSTSKINERNYAQAEGFVPFQILETEIGQPLHELLAFNEKIGHSYQCAFCLIRLHTLPLGVLKIQLTRQGISASEYSKQIWDNMQTLIVKHLQEDGLPIVAKLDEAGLPSIPPLKCIEERESFLQTAPFVSVIVATRDHPEYLAQCLNSLLALQYPCFEIIVVDNAPSTSATADFIQQIYSNEPKIKYVLETCSGLSSARNCGLKFAKGEILAFTDDDVVVDPYWLVELAKAFNCSDNIACVTGLVLPLELGTKSQIWFEEFGGLTKGFTRRIFDSKANYPDIPLYPFAAGQFGTGANMAFTSAFLRSRGGFDTALGTGTRTGGGEDLAAFFEVIRSGYRLVYEPAALLYHLHRREYAQLRKQIYYYGVGLMAFLTKIVLENPLSLFDLIAKLPFGLFFILSSQSSKNEKRTKEYPKDLIILERKGMLYGPFAYLRCLWERRKIAKRTFVFDETCGNTLGN
jgi:glycosyltransferase involved in cell wall biosynthesis